MPRPDRNLALLAGSRASYGDGYSRFSSDVLSFNVRDFGVKGDGSDETAAVRDAARELVAAGGGELFYPPGFYKHGSISIDTSGAAGATVSVRGAGRNATIINPLSTLLFDFGSASAYSSGLLASDFTVRLTANVDYSNGIIRLRKYSQFIFERIELWGGPTSDAASDNFRGYLFEFDTAYVGSVNNCMARGRRVYLFEANANANAGEQQDTIDFIGSSSFGVLGGIFRESGGDYNAISFINFKHLLLAGWPETSVSVESVLNGATLAGVNTATFTSVVGLVANDLVLVGVGTNIEMAEIQAINGAVVTFKTNLRFAHANGDPTLKGGVGVCTSRNSFSFTFVNFRSEFAAASVMGQAARQFIFITPFGTQRDVFRAIAAAAGVEPCRDVMVFGASVEGNGGVNNVIRVTAAADEATNRFFIYGPLQKPSTGNEPTTKFQNDAGTNRNTRSLNGVTGGLLADIITLSAQQSTIVEQLSAAGTVLRSQTAQGEHFARWYRGDVNTPAVLGAGNNVDYDPSFFATLRLQGGAASVLTGFIGGAAGRRLRIVNVSATAFNIAHQDATSAAANRVINPSAAAVVVAANGGTADLEYDAISSRWRLHNLI